MNQDSDFSIDVDALIGKLRAAKEAAEYKSIVLEVSLEEARREISELRQEVDVIAQKVSDGQES